MDVKIRSRFRWKQNFTHFHFHHHPTDSDESVAVDLGPIFHQKLVSLLLDIRNDGAISLKQLSNKGCLSLCLFTSVFQVRRFVNVDDEEPEENSIFVAS
jgi:hypothetical protein